MAVDEAETMENNGPIISNGGLNPDTEHLILPDDDSLKDEPLEIQVHIKKPTRSIVIEPLFLLIVASLLPMSLLMGIYVYDRLKKEVAIDYGIPVENISDMHCQEVDMNSTLYLAQERAQDLNARFNIYYSFSYSIPCLITTLFLSGYSDRAGRKYAIVSPAVGFLIYGVINCVILFADLPLWCLFISGFFLGAGGSYQMLLAGCFAYLGDTVESNKIMFRITVIELLAFMLGSLGPLFVGNLIPVIGYSYLCLIFAFMNLLSFLYAVFFIPEIIIPTERISIFSLSHLKSCVDLYTKDTPDGNRRWKLILLIVTFFFIATVNLGNTGIWTLFELGQPLCWTSAHIGDFTAIYVSCGTVVGIVLTKTLKVRLEDEQICFISGLSGIGHYTYQVFVKTSIMMYFGKLEDLLESLGMRKQVHFSS